MEIYEAFGSRERRLLEAWPQPRQHFILLRGDSKGEIYLLGDGQEVSLGACGKDVSNFGDNFDFFLFLTVQKISW